MKEIERLLIDNHRYFWKDIYNVEKEELRVFKSFIDYIDNNLIIYRVKNLDYNYVTNLFINNHLNYLKETFLSITLGNYNSCATYLRLIIENYVGFMLIKKYKNQKAWRDWFLWSNYKTIKDLENNYSDKKDIVIIKQQYQELCNLYKVNNNYICNCQPYGWLEKIVKQSRYSFKSVCGLIDFKIYEDFLYLNSYVYNNRIFSKRSLFFVQNLTKFISIAYKYTNKILTEYNYHFTRRSEYSVLCKNLLESFDKCNNCQDIM